MGAGSTNCQCAERRRKGPAEKGGQNDQERTSVMRFFSGYTDNDSTSEEVVVISEAHLPESGR